MQKLLAILPLLCTLPAGLSQKDASESDGLSHIVSTSNISVETATYDFTLVESGTVGETGCTRASVKCVYKPWHPGTAAWISFFILGTLPGNFLVVLAFIKKPSLRTSTNTLILNQSVADLLSAFTAIIFVFMNYTYAGLAQMLQSKAACLASLWLLMFSLSASLFNIFTLSMERFIAVFFPYKYIEVVTPNAAWFVNVVVWVVVFVINSLPAWGMNVWRQGSLCFTHSVYTQTYLSYIYMAPKGIILILALLFHISISAIAYKKSKAVADHIVFKDAIDKLIQQDFKITKMFLLVVGVFYLSWLPWIICTFLTLTADKPSIALLIMHDVSKGFLGLGPMVNPLIYAYKNKLYRNTFKKILGMNADSDMD